MAAIRQQGNYLTIFLTAFVVFTAGLVELWDHGMVIGVILSLVGLALFVYSLAGFRRIKSLEYIKE